MTLNIGDPGSSNEDGFGNVRFQALPFDSQARIQELDLWLALRTAVSVEIDIDGAGAIAQTGAYVDVPRLNAHVTPVSDVDINCDPITPSTDNSDEDKNILTDPIKVEVYGSYDYGAYAKVILVACCSLRVTIAHQKYRSQRLILSQPSSSQAAFLSRRCA